MKFDKYDNDSLINFYIENGLEFDERKKYFGNNIRSFALLENENIIGAVSISIYVDKKYRNRGYGKSLIEKAIGELEKPVYIISKVDEFYLKNGFVYSNEELIDKECKACNEYNITCFPKVVVYR